MGEYLPIILVLSFILGVTVGSFLNVLIFRLRSGVTLHGRSKCLACAKPLRAKHLVPLFSYLVQRGRCAFCGVKISLQYPLVEGVLGALYVGVLVVHGFDPLTTTLSDAFLIILDASVWTILLAVTVYDWKHKIIPDSFSLLLAIVAGVGLLFKWQMGLLPVYFLPLLDTGTLPSWIDLVAGPLLALPFAMLWFFSGGRAMGLGDAKLAWGLGWFLGFPYGVSAIVFAFWIAFIPSILLLFLPSKRFTMKSEIPFAPFLVLGALVAYLTNINILTWTF